MESSAAQFRRLSPFTTNQWGLVTRQQALNAGVPLATFARLTARQAGPAVLDRVAQGVYHLLGAPMSDHADLRAAWLQLAPEVPAWRRTADQGVASHRSAAELTELGHLPADRHEFVLPARRQSRRPDVRLHIGRLADDDWLFVHGLPATRPARTAADLLADGEDPGAVAEVIADAIRAGLEQPRAFPGPLGRGASRLGLARGDGAGALAWLLDLVADPEAPGWLAEASSAGSGRPAATPVD